MSKVKGKLPKQEIPSIMENPSCSKKARMKGSCIPDQEKLVLSNMHKGQNHSWGFTTVYRLETPGYTPF